MLLSNTFCGSLQRLPVARTHRNPAALRGECLGCGASNSLTGSGNQRNSIFQSKIHEAEL